MKIFNIFKFKNWGLVKVYRDFENYFDWIETIKKEELNPTSKFNKWGLKRTKLYDVYVSVSLDDMDAQLPDMIQKTKVLESLNPIHRYLDEELKFAGNLACEFNQFIDDKQKPTLTYLIVYRFIFEKFSLLWLAKFLIFNGAALFAILKYDLIPYLISWVSNLI